MAHTGTTPYQIVSDAYCGGNSTGQSATDPMTAFSNVKEMRTRILTDPPEATRPPFDRKFPARVYFSVCRKLHAHSTMAGAVPSGAVPGSKSFDWPIAKAREAVGDSCRSPGNFDLRSQRRLLSGSRTRRLPSAPASRRIPCRRVLPEAPLPAGSPVLSVRRPRLHAHCGRTRRLPPSRLHRCWRTPRKIASGVGTTSSARRRSRPPSRTLRCIVSR